MKKILFLVLLTVILSLSLICTSCGYNCKTCHDKFKIVCYDCDGKKQSRCSRCGGDGMAPCGLCTGTGSRTCFSCGGMGSRLEYDFFSKMYVYKDCYVCAGGRVSCIMTTVCGCVDGKINCNTCDAQGKIDCPDCSFDLTDTQ